MLPAGGRQQRRLAVMELLLGDEELVVRELIAGGGVVGVGLELRCVAGGLFPGLVAVFFAVLRQLFRRKI